MPIIRLHPQWRICHFLRSLIAPDPPRGENALPHGEVTNHDSGDVLRVAHRKSVVYIRVTLSVVADKDPLHLGKFLGKSF